MLSLIIKNAESQMIKNVFLALFALLKLSAGHLLNSLSLVASEEVDVGTILMRRVPNNTIAGRCFEVYITHFL